jgi:hypothetical protein
MLEGSLSMKDKLIRMLAFAAVVAPSCAYAAVSGLPPNYTFPGSEGQGFKFSTSGGIVNPGVIVGFNPQPDPPASLFVNLGDVHFPTVTVGSPDTDYHFILSFTGITDFHSIVAPDMPNPDGFTRYEFAGDGSVFVADIQFSGPSQVASWVAFNPQPDPPGDLIAYMVGFGDASVTLHVTENGHALSFALVPEPSTWALMGLGFAALGGLAYRRGAQSSALGSGP